MGKKVEEEEKITSLAEPSSTLRLQKKKKILSSSVNSEANIRVGKDFLMKLSFHSEIVKEEEYLFLLYNETPPTS